MTDIFDEYRDQLAGVWKLVSYNLLDGDGPDARLIAKPHGDDPFGRVVILPSGYMAATLTPPDRAQPLETQEWAEASDTDILRVTRMLTTYSGPVKLFERDGELVWECTVEIAINPNWIGKTQVRRVEFVEEKGQRYMRLRPVRDLILPDGTRARGKLDWERIKLAT